jgi:hypothetical protein
MVFSQSLQLLSPRTFPFRGPSLYLWTLCEYSHMLDIYSALKYPPPPPHTNSLLNESVKDVLGVVCGWHAAVVAPLG